MADFGKQVAGYVETYKKRLRATAREATQETVAIATKPRAKGGRMRVDTGFLRASGVAAVGQMPSGPTTNEGNTDYGDGEREGLPDKQVSGEPIAVTLLRWDPNTGKPLFYGFTANYARPREYKDGFLRGATELWPDTVDKAAREARRRIR